MGDREYARRSYATGWHRAGLFVPDTARRVLILVANDSGKLHASEARYSLGWRFINPRDVNRRPERVRAWMDIPWWDQYEKSKSETPASKPAGTKTWAEGQAEAQEFVRSNGDNSLKEVGLSASEADFAEGGWR